MLPLLLATFALVPSASARSAYVLGEEHDLDEGTTAYTAATLVNLRADFASGADVPVVSRLPVGTRVKVVEQVADRVEVTVGDQHGWIARELLSTMGRTTDLDGDGVEERIVVSREPTGETLAWIREGTHVDHVSLYDDPSPYLGEWALVPAAEAGVPLLRIQLGQDACGEFPSAWLSYQDGHLQKALEVVEVGDGMSSSTFDVTFDPDGRAVITGTVMSENDETRTTRSCELQAGVFRCS